MSLEEFFEYTNEEEQHLFNNIAEQVENLGYKLKRDKTKDINYVFYNSKAPKNILKFSIEKGNPTL